MLFPYYAQPENLTSHRRWSLKDSHTTATDVHAAVGSPATFRLRFISFFLALVCFYKCSDCKKSTLLKVH